MKKFLSSLLKVNIHKSKEEFNSNVQYLIKKEIPVYEFREYEYKYKLPRLIQSAFQWFRIINRNLLNIEYEIIDEGEIIENYRISPTYVKKFKVRGITQIFRESGKIEYEGDFSFTLRVPSIVDKYYFIIKGTKYVPTLHYSSRPVLYYPNKISISGFGISFILDINRMMSLFSESYSHLTGIYVLYLLYDPFRDSDSYKNFAKFLYFNMPFNH